MSIAQMPGNVSCDILYLIADVLPVFDETCRHIKFLFSFVATAILNW
jgi:hypothetical protein